MEAGNVGWSRCGPKSWKRLCVLRCTLVVTMVLLGIAAAIIYRHGTRGRLLGATLQTIESSRFCWVPHRNRRICAMEPEDVAAAEVLGIHAQDRLMGFMYAQVANKSKHSMQEILDGAYVSVSDPEHWGYDSFIAADDAYKRACSHASSDQTYGMTLSGSLRSMLVGTDDSRTLNYTWFQFEGADQHTTWLGHTLDYWEYKITGRNIGPLGTSGYTDWNPIVLGKTELASSACPIECEGDHAPTSKTGFLV